MSTAAIAQPKVETAILLLKDQRPSGFIKEGTENTQNPEELTAPSLYRLPNTSVRVVKNPDGPGVIHEKIRYIYGCDTINMEEQRKRKIEPNNGNQLDQIYFTSGILNIANDGATRTLYEYVTQCIEFEGAPNRPDDYEPLYYRHDKEKSSEARLQKHDLISKAQAIVEGLYEEKAGEYIYDEEKIDYLCTVLGVRAEDPATKTATLLDFAHARPDLVVKYVEQHVNLLKANVMLARNLGVITFMDGKLKNTETDADLYSFSKKAKDEEDMIAETIKFLSGTDTGKQFYQDMGKAIEAKQVAMLSAK